MRDTVIPLSSTMLTIHPIPAFKDNYIWTLHDGHHAVVVDPGDATPVQAYLATHHLKLAAILCTHHHNDHTGGICELQQQHSCPVYAPRLEDIPCRTVAVGEGEIIEIASLQLALRVMEIPGHTRGHVAYLGADAVFCGDTLFGCGCGRLFEGTPAQLLHSLHRLAALPENTLVYCTHEYTQANIRFALACEPTNQTLLQREQEVLQLRAAGLPTLPSSIALERASNPFLRCTESEIAQNVAQHIALNSLQELDVFTAMRSWKNTF